MVAAVDFSYQREQDLALEVLLTVVPLNKLTEVSTVTTFLLSEGVLEETLRETMQQVMTSLDVRQRELMRTDRL